jgi:hypothetical protein
VPSNLAGELPPSLAYGLDAFSNAVSSAWSSVTNVAGQISASTKDAWRGVAAGEDHLGTGNQCGGMLPEEGYEEHGGRMPGCSVFQHTGRCG